jgi:hypothetical protein
MFQGFTALIDQLMVYCWVSAHVLDERSGVSEKALPKRRNALLLRCAEAQ